MKTILNLIIILIISGCAQEVPELLSGTESITVSTTDCMNFTVSPDTMIKITGDSYIPLYGRDTSLVNVADFYLDVYPVTNYQYLQFVNTHPKWKKSQVKNIFADDQYLHFWVNDTSYHANLQNQ